MKIEIVESMVINDFDKVARPMAADEFLDWLAGGARPRLVSVSDPGG